MHFLEFATCTIFFLATQLVLMASWQCDITLVMASEIQRSPSRMVQKPWSGFSLISESSTVSTVNEFIAYLTYQRWILTVGSLSSPRQ